jgi:hypothetical protein
MATFSVGVKAKRESVLIVPYGRRAETHYVVEAETERKAENVVKRYLKKMKIGEAAYEVIGATPAVILGSRESLRNLERSCVRA